MFEDGWGKKNFNNEEIDLDNSDLEKLEELKDKLIKRKEDIKNIINK